MPTATPTAGEDLLPSLQGEIHQVLSPLLQKARRCALLDFPDYPNVGDSAIWLGAKACLRRFGVPVAYSCSLTTYSQSQLAVRLEDGVILLQGGGNLGDLWPEIQDLRERVIAAFPDKPIVQLPQTIHFQQQANLKRAKAIFNRHPDLTILVRDRPSLELARNEFRARSLLCPDLALALGALERPETASEDIVWLSRTDIESAGHRPLPAGSTIVPVDWVRDDDTLLLSAHYFIEHQAFHHPGTFGRLVRLLASRYTALDVYDRLATQRLVRGCRTLSRGKVVVTDRLHGHILSLLLGLPHVVLDNNYGKVRAFYETWTKGSTLAVWANGPEEALKEAMALARQTPGCNV